MIGNFSKSFDLVLGHEQGYVNNPLDKGGPTKWGITLATLTAWRCDSRVTSKDIENLSTAEARDIYHTKYWNTMRCDLLPSGLDYAVFDAAVNSGPFRAAKWLQKAVGVKEDGHLGPVTLEAVDKHRTLMIGLLQHLCRLRLAYLLSLDNTVEETFEKGWANRILSVLQVATLMSERDKT